MQNTGLVKSNSAAEAAVPTSRSAFESETCLAFRQVCTEFFFSSTEFPLRALWKSRFPLVMQSKAGSISSPIRMPRRTRHSGQILLFPSTPAETNQRYQDISAAVAKGGGEALARVLAAAPEEYRVVLSGTYRKDFAGLKAAYDELLDLGCKVLSPTNVTPVSESNGFVFMKGEESQLPETIESRHLDAIQRANFIWLHAPEGYVGPTASLEIGFARAVGIPVFSRDTIKDPAIHSFVDVAPSPAAAIEYIKDPKLSVPRPAVAAFQEYYRRIATQRGYSSESAKDCLLLMVEEVGELAREIRKKERLARYGSSSESSESRELADVFLYVVHMANVLHLDLAKIVQEKELINLQKFLER